ncbi:MAG TPA: hypothetical protein PK987_03965 [Ferruginibacter sp.]|nr:hypothetical protein [Ferruginibacter sp.]
MLIKSHSIKKIVAAFLLLVFAFSITPTIILHNWFAHHTDAVANKREHHKETIGIKLFNCHCDNIVAVSPFTEPEKIDLLPIVRHYTVASTVVKVYPISTASILYSLRGPPAV